MNSMITMVILMIVVTRLFVIEASDDMLPVVCIKSLPSGVIGMMVTLCKRSSGKYCQTYCHEKCRSCIRFVMNELHG